MALGGARLPTVTCNRIRAFLEDTREPPAAIAIKCGVSKRTVERMRLSFELFGQPYPDPVQKTGRPIALTEAQVQWILDYLKDQPTAYLDELALAVYDEFGVHITLVTVWSVLKRKGWSRKIAKEKAAQRSALLRNLWRTRCVDWPVEKLVFVDESASNERTGYRKRGWSPQGVDCSILRTLRRSER